MSQVHIVASQGSLLYASAEMTPYDLENLRSHVRDLRGSTSARVEFAVDGAHARRSEVGVSALVTRLTADGVQVVQRRPRPAPSRHTERGH
jgi:hypothetical protein